ncbi:MAG: hypothetical protein ACN4E6_18170 [Qipengyuania pacifica]|jgi:hypothetical protein
MATQNWESGKQSERGHLASGKKLRQKYCARTPKAGADRVD